VGLGLLEPPTTELGPLGPVMCRGLDILAPRLMLTVCTPVGLPRPVGVQAPEL
jgi:hypothetical protein